MDACARFPVRVMALWLSRCALIRPIMHDLCKETVPGRVVHKHVQNRLQFHYWRKPFPLWPRPRQPLPERRHRAGTIWLEAFEGPVDCQAFGRT